MVARLKDDCEIQKWNMRSWSAGFPQDCLQEGDVIIGVNGLRGSEAILSNEMQCSGDLFLVVERQVQLQ